MNEGQEKFFNFILDRVQEGKQDEAKAFKNNKMAHLTWNT